MSPNRFGHFIAIDWSGAAGERHKGIALAMAVAVVFALIMGFPTLRLKGPYFALAMLSGAVIMQRLMLIFWEYTGGEEGINGIEPLLRNPMHYYWLVLAALVLTTLLLGALARSNWGLILRAIRGDEATCQAVGLNVTFYKIAALVISDDAAGFFYQQSACSNIPNFAVDVPEEI